MLNIKTIKQIKDDLLARRHQLYLQLTKETDINVDIDGDETDEIQGNLLFEVSSKIIHRNNSKIKKINEALSKIEDNTYGICEDCEEEIAEKRLLLNPYFTTCIFCAELREKEEKQRKRSSS